MTIRLNNKTLNEIGGSVALPKYDRSKLTAGILHFGIGNFHRAHQAVYLDDLMNQGEALDWGVLGAGVMAADSRMKELLAAQDYLTTIVEEEAQSRKVRVTGSMCGFVTPGDAAATVAALTDPAIRIVSMTVTEGGYFIDPLTAAFDETHPAMMADAKSPDRPKTVFGIIAAGLAQRRANGDAPFTVMSCDNIPHNGNVARNAVAGVAALSDPAFAEWIIANVAFPNGMVDRIATATTDAQRQTLAVEYGVEDGWPVFCEDFRQWVLEDSFPAGRPPLEAAGVQFVSDVTPYEHMKIRILNGGHAIIGYPAGLLGIEYVHEAMAHPLIAAFLQKVALEEIIPIIPPVPNTDLNGYLALIKTRFANPKIGDTIGRICFDGSNRQPKFIIPSIADRLDAGASVTGLALESALWCRYCFGMDEKGATIGSNDPDWSALQDRAKAAKSSPSEWIAMDNIYGDLANSQSFSRSFSKSLSSLWQVGVEATLRSYVDGHG